VNENNNSNVHTKLQMKYIVFICNTRSIIHSGRQAGRRVVRQARVRQAGRRVVRQARVRQAGRRVVRQAGEGHSRREFSFSFLNCIHPEGNYFSALYPIQTCPSSGGQARSSRQPPSAAPGDQLSCSRHWSDDALLHVFSGGLYMEEPQGAHANSTHKGPFFDEIAHLAQVGIDPRTFWLWGVSSTTEPPCYRAVCLLNISIQQVQCFISPSFAVHKLFKCGQGSCQMSE